MIDLHDIPFSYLVSWAKRNKKRHSGLTYLGTLNSKPEAASYGCWGDVLSTLGSGKCLQKLLAGLDQCQTSIIRDYEDYVNDANNADDGNTIYLPKNAAQYSNFYERAKAFIIEYAQEIKRSSLTLSEPQKRDKERRELIFREKFVYTHTNRTPTDRGVLKNALKISRQRVDQLYDEITEECIRCLSGEKVGRAVADPALISDFASLKQKVGTMISKESFLRVAGIAPGDEKTIEFLAETLGMRIMIKKDQPIPVIAAKGLLGDYSNSIGYIISFFSKEVFGIRSGIELRAELNKITDDALREAFLSFIMNSEEFIKYRNGNDDAVALRWDYLASRPAKLCYILYEKGAFEYGQAIQASELVKLYNNYARRYGQPQISPDQLPSIAQIRSSGCWKLMSLGKTGYWKIRLNEREEYNLDKIIRTYLTDKGASASFDDFLDLMKTSGQLRFYPNERSLRARYTKNGGTIDRQAANREFVNRLSREHRSKRFEFILDYLNTLGTTCTIADLYQVLKKEYPETNQATVGQWVKALFQEGKINAVLGSGRRPTYLSAPTVPIQPPRTLKDDIAETALDIVWESPDHELSSSMLYPQLVAILPDTVNSKTQMVSRTLKRDGRFVFKGPSGHSTIGLSRETLAKMAKKNSVRQLQTTNTGSDDSLSFNIDNFKECLSEEFSNDLRKYGIDAAQAIDKLLLIYGTGSPINKKFSFFDILSYLPHHYKRKLDDDRERRLVKDSPALVELFLKEFYELKHDKNITDVIKHDWGVKVPGFGTMVSYLEQNYNYIPYKGDYTTQEARNMKSLVKSVIDARNQRAHPDHETDISKYNHEKTIHDCFLMMLYVASKY